MFSKLLKRIFIVENYTLVHGREENVWELFQWEAEKVKLLIDSTSALSFKIQIKLVSGWTMKLLFLLAKMVHYSSS